MSNKTKKKGKIAWTDETWNPTTGCSKISAGCANCYACEISKWKRNLEKGTGETKYQNGFIPTIHEEELERPYHWRKKRKVFVNSMSDLFHDDFMDTGFIEKVFKVMNDCPDHDFQILTKRGYNLEKIAPLLKWTPNIWMGVSIENEAVFSRIDNLRNTPAHVKFLSVEPLLEALPNLNVKDLSWVIIGGETGHNARPMQKEWVYDIKDKCDQANIPFFFKQMGGSMKQEGDLLLLDRVKYHNFPN